MIWSIDLCKEKGKENLTVMKMGCCLRDNLDHDPCIFIVEDNNVIAQNTNFEIQINFITREPKSYVHNSVALQDIGQVTRYFWKNNGYEEISNSFVADYSKMTEIVMLLIQKLSNPNELNHMLKYITDKHYSYDCTIATGYQFYQHTPDLESDNPERITMEVMLKNIFRASLKKPVIISENMERHIHDGILLYQFLEKQGIMDIMAIHQ